MLTRIKYDDQPSPRKILVDCVWLTCAKGSIAWAFLFRSFVLFPGADKIYHRTIKQAVVNAE